MNLNRIFILGNLANDPENRMLPSGQPVTNFRVATNRVWKDAAGNRQEAAEFHRVVAFGSLADVATRYLAKGRLVLVEGRVQTRSWQAQDGTKRYQTEVVAQGLQLGPRLAGQPSPQRNEPLAAPAGIAAQPTPPAPTPAPTESAQAEEPIPVVDLDEEDSVPQEGQKIRPEDLPF